MIRNVLPFGFGGALGAMMRHGILYILWTVIICIACAYLGWWLAQRLR